MEFIDACGQPTAVIEQVDGDVGDGSGVLGQGELKGVEDPDPLQPAGWYS
ncbi:hypothetical protein [Streptomyces mirabilis]